MNTNWTDLMPLTDSFEGEVVRVELANKNLAIYQINGKVYCTDNQCTHGNALLSDGVIDGYEIECPFHQKRRTINLLTLVAALPSCLKREERREKREERREKRE